MSKIRGFGNWIYEQRRVNRDSVLAARALFLTGILEKKPRVVEDLFKSVLPPFFAVVADRLPTTPGSAGKVAIHTVDRSLEWPSERTLTAAFKNWTALQSEADAKQFCEALKDWATAFNLSSAPWCYDQAIRCLRQWVLDETLSRAFDQPQLLASRITKGWIHATTRAYTETLVSRCNLQMQVYSDPLYSEQCQTFRSALKAESIDLETQGWPFLEIGKNEWQRLVNSQFDEVLHHYRSHGKQARSEGARSIFTKALTQYLEHADSARRRLVSKYTLVKAPQHYRSGHDRDDHINWLIYYQIPPTRKYSEISAGLESSGATTEIVRKYVCKTARLIGIKLRNPKEHAGRPSGQKTGDVPSAAFGIGHRKSPKRE